MLSYWRRSLVKRSLVVAGAALILHAHTRISDLFLFYISLGMYKSAELLGG